MSIFDLFIRNGAVVIDTVGIYISFDLRTLLAITIAIAARRAYVLFYK